MDKIFLSELQTRGVIGVYEEERKQPQEILVNLTIYANLRQAGESDNLRDSIDYQSVAESVVQHIETARRYTVEALAADLAEICLAIDQVKKVKVRVEKPAALPCCRSVGVEIIRKKSGES